MSSIRIIQFTDTHLFGNPEGRLMGADTNRSFLAVWERIRNAKNKPETILVTGDLTQDDSLESYQWLTEQLNQETIPYYWLCGNHDHTSLMQQACPDAMQKRVQLGNWQIILLNTQVPGKIPGYLEASELELLERYLSDNPELHTLVALHHPPYDVNSQWLDKIHLQNADELFQVLSGHNNVRAVLNGHIHQESDRLINGIRCLATPSTCVQFKPESDDFQLDETAPGYRELELQPDGSINTQVIRLDNYRLELDLTSNGY